MRLQERQDEACGSPVRNHSRINAYNPIILSCWAANMDVQILLDAYGAAIFTASYMTEHDKSKHPPRILYQLSKNARNQSANHLIRRIILSVLKTREVSVQEASWIRTGTKLCTSSRIYLTLPCLHFAIGEDSRPRRTDGVLIFADGSVRHSSALILFCVQHPESLKDLPS